MFYARKKLAALLAAERVTGAAAQIARVRVVCRPFS
jgi:hypothetical protein